MDARILQRTCLLWALACCVLSVRGQFAVSLPESVAEDSGRPFRQKHEVKVDDPRLECIYAFAGKDPVIKVVRRVAYIMQIGAKWTKWSDYSDYLKDSVCWRTDWKITVGEMDERFGKWSSFWQESQLRDRAGDTFACMGGTTYDRFIYEDSTARMDWTLTEDTATVCGYACRKATARFRGRDWTAWYAEKLPEDAGPWKLHGLPGLILRAEADSGLLRFEAVQVRVPEGETYYVARTIPGPEDVPMAREDVLKLEREVLTGFDTYMEQKLAKLSPSERPTIQVASLKRMFYQPLELE